jgi:hypothetical protein
MKLMHLEMVDYCNKSLVYLLHLPKLLMKLKEVGIKQCRGGQLHFIVALGRTIDTVSVTSNGQACSTILSSIETEHDACICKLPSQ